MLNPLNILLAVLLLATQLPGVGALDNGLGDVPPLGYNTWNDVGCDVSEELVRSRAEFLVRPLSRPAGSGPSLSKLGFRYVNIDDCWHAKERNSTTHKLQPDPVRFPSGMRNLSDYLHSLGLSFGLYTDRGTSTCAGYPGSQGYEELDAQTFAEWGVDYLKEDNCYATPTKHSQLDQYSKMRDALNATGRRVFFNLCGGGWEIPVLSDLRYFAKPPFGGLVGNSWRVSADVSGTVTLLAAVSATLGLEEFSGSGQWNDPDMLLSSSSKARVRLSETESRTQFSLWAVLAAPLLLGGNPLVMSDWDLETYSNADVIDINQQRTPQGKALYFESWTEGLVLVALRKLEREHDWAMIFVNHWPVGGAVKCDGECWGKSGIPNGTVLNATDVWSKQHHRLVVGQEASFDLQAWGGSVLLRVTLAQGELKATGVREPLLQHRDDRIVDVQ